METAAFAESFAPIVQCEKREIHPVFPLFPHFPLGQNLSAKALAPLCGIAIKNTGSCHLTVCPRNNAVRGSAMVSQAERDIRWEKLKQRMDQEGLNGIVILGSGAFGPKENGHYRFYVDNRVYYYIQAMVLGADGEPVIICGSQTHLDVLRSRNFRDIRMVGDRIAEGIADALVSKSITEGTVGICADQLPASWYLFEICNQ